MRKEATPSNTLGLGVKFIAIVVFVLFISAIFKIVDVVRNSTYDSKANFYILDPQSFGFDEIVISPSQNSVLILKYKTSDKSLSSASLPYNLISQYDSDYDKDNFKSAFPKVLSQASANPLDFFKLNSFVIQSSNISSVTIDSSDKLSLKQIPQLIQDPQISQENSTIEVANATGVSGVGSVVARMITYLGGNVVLVSTSGSTDSDSKIETIDKNSIAAKELKKMFNAKIIYSKPLLSDIKITVGKDLLPKIGL